MGTVAAPGTPRCCLPAACLRAGRAASPPGAAPALFSPLQAAAGPFPLPVLRPAPRRAGAWPVSSARHPGGTGGRWVLAVPRCAGHRGPAVCLGGSDPAQPPRSPARQRGHREPSLGGSGRGGAMWYKPVGFGAPSQTWAALLSPPPMRGSCPPQVHRDHPILPADAPPPHRTAPDRPQIRTGTAGWQKVGDKGTDPQPLGCRVALPRRQRAIPRVGAEGAWGA